MMAPAGNSDILLRWWEAQKEINSA